MCMIALVIGIKTCFKDKVCCLKYSTTTSVSNCCLTLAMRVPSYDGFDVVVLSADTVI